MVPTDARDNHIVATALEGGADTIVTEDTRDLLSLKVVKVRGFPTVRIVDARTFLLQLQARRSRAP
jgi:predicted nucleic acid-binding protein